MSSDWNTAANWRPNTVPNGPTDTATFAASDTTGVSLSSATEVSGVVFTPGASSFTITPDPGIFSFTGLGIANNSGLPQNFVTNQTYATGLNFYNQATAGTQAVFTAESASNISFYDEATAGFGTFLIKGTEYFEDGHCHLYFYDNSSAANGIFINTGGSGAEGEGGETRFSGDSTAANGTFTNTAASDSDAYSGGYTTFSDNSTAAEGIFTNEGSVVGNGYAGTFTTFEDNATAGNATITCNGGEVAGAEPGQLLFLGTASAGSAALIAKGGLGGAGGGRIMFGETSNGGEARVELFGNGTLDLANLTSPGLTIGSLEGNGIVLLDTHSITIGSNDLSTSFRGLIQDSGAVIKVGLGTLTLTGASTYTGGTTVSEGFLRVDNRVGSATGTGAVQVNGGTLGGAGILSGAVTVGSGSGLGAFIAPGTGASTLTIQGALTFKSDGTYIWRIRATGTPKADKVVANGVSIESGAQIKGLGHGTVATGTILTAIDNTAATAIAGTFANLPDGGTLSIGNNTFQANYEGGDGNDLTLTVVP